MKRIWGAGMALALCLTLLAGCAPGSRATSGGGDDKLTVYASFYVMYDFASKVGGDRAQVVNLVPSGAAAHDWEPTPADIVNLEKADVFVYNGAGMEHWVESVLSSLQNEKLLAVDTSEGIALLERQDGDEHEDEDHDEEEHDHGKYDPHLWLSPATAKQQMENIKDAFSQADPDNADYYEQNYLRYAAEFDKLDQEFSDAIKDARSRDLVVSHRAYGYLCDRYGLNQIAVEGLSDESEPDPASMAGIIETVKEKDIREIFFSSTASSKVMDTIASATGAKTGVLSAVESLTKEQLDAGEDYFSVMRENLTALTEALS